MRIRKSAGIMALLFLLVLTDCRKEEEVEEVSKTAETLTVKKMKEMYKFVDVEGNSYEAELLKIVPKHSYDYNRIIDENGFRYYTDAEGNKISRLGIDVSEYQPNVDWNQIKAAGADFVMVRLGYRGYGEAGNLVEDPKFRAHVEGAKAAGLDVGVYFFSQAITDAEVEEEAMFVLDRIKDYEITCPVVFDTEEIEFGTARTDHLPPEQFTKNCRIFCDIVEEAGYDTMIYANMKWLAFTLDLEKLADYEKWYADYEPHPQCPYDFSMWQYTETGTILGIEGNVDLNVWFPEETK